MNNIQRLKSSHDPLQPTRSIPKYAGSLLVWNAKPITRTTTARHNGRVVRIIPNNKEVILRAR